MKERSDIAPGPSVGPGRGRVGGIVIGRNEGPRLARCLTSLANEVDALVYVDSASSDGSAAVARGLGATVVELDASRPYTAARARNAGFARVRELVADLELVQFVDGDCELIPGWVEASRRFLEAQEDVAAVAGRLREREPDATPWNRLADMEWDGPVGDVSECGGIAMMRASAFAEVGGFDASMIAGEEPELCLRLRRAGHRIVRLGEEMGLHDAALLRFREWWRRQIRAGHSYAEQLWLQRRAPEAEAVRRLLSIAVWGGAIPAGSLVLAWPSGGLSLLLLLAYGWLWARLLRSRPGDEPRHAALYATASCAGKLAQVWGALTFGWNHLVRRRPTALIDKRPQA